MTISTYSKSNKNGVVCYPKKDIGVEANVEETRLRLIIVKTLLKEMVYTIYE